MSVAPPPGLFRPAPRRFAWFVLGYTLFVILWGAFVRASVSGDGCGAHWPSCQGGLIPSFANLKTAIEFFHRVTSGALLPMVLVLFALSFRASPKGHALRRAAAASVLFTLTEALVGAWLVLRGLVAYDSSVDRAIWMSIHLVNTFLLLGSMALTAAYAGGATQIRFRGQGPILWAIGFGVFGVLLLGVSGAVTALGDTLFPSGTLVEGLKQDLSETAHFLIRLRLFHPMIAVSVGLYITLVAGLVSYLRPSADVRRYSRWVVGIFGLELVVGLINLLMLAPIWMQLVHLLIADCLWIALILQTRSALADDVERVELRSRESKEPHPLPTGSARPALWKQYIALTKPRVISLLLFTTLAAMFAAAGGWPGGWLLLAVAVGGYMSAGAANTINMVLERDLDERMKRTSTRPTVTQDIPSSHALVFGLVLASSAFVLLSFAANVLAAVLSFAGLVFYVVVYTLLLKRRTWHNIVIGGAAGAFPPLVGWAAVTDSLSPLAWYLFAIIFLWTPVHFWALAILIKDDYAAAGVPMAPVVLGERATVIQIVFYAILTAVVSIMPMLQPGVGWFYLATAVLLNAFLVIRCMQLYWSTDRPHAVSLYKYSMAYLALLFIAAAIDWGSHVARTAPPERTAAPHAKPAAMRANLWDSDPGAGKATGLEIKNMERSNATAL